VYISITLPNLYLKIHIKDINNFTAVREENKKRQIRLYEQQEAKRAHLQKYIDLHAQAGENGVKAARQRKSRMKKVSIECDILPLVSISNR
jgi:ATPase subunit of ABC transporter with duplicated ATPase domains